MPPFLAFLLHPTVEHKMLAFPVAAAAAVAPGADIVNEKCWSLDNMLAVLCIVQVVPW